MFTTNPQPRYWGHRSKFPKKARTPNADSDKGLHIVIDAAESCNGYLYCAFNPEIPADAQAKRGKSHIDALSLALVDFHRSQCYFIAAIQIASFVLDSQAYRDYERSIPSPIFDVLLSIPLSLNGLVPTVFPLCSISEFGHLSWHVIILSILCIVLSTESLITTYIWILIIDKNTNQDTLGEIAGGFDYASTLETARSAPNRET